MADILEFKPEPEKTEKPLTPEDAFKLATELGTKVATALTELKVPFLIILPSPSSGDLFKSSNMGLDYQLGVLYRSAFSTTLPMYATLNPIDLVARDMEEGEPA